MAEIIIMPKLGFNMDEGQLVKWHKALGDSVTKGEVLFEINTDKTTMPVEATAEGVVLDIFLQEGEYADVFTPICVVGAPGEAYELPAGGGASPDAPAQAEPAAPASTPQQAPGGGYDYDLAVIGAGPGGYVTAIKAAQMGKKVCIFEDKYFGGTCLNVGCIPTKTLIKSASLLHEVQHAATFALEGIDPAAVKVSMPKLQQRKQQVIGQLVGGVGGLLRANKVEVIQGQASFVDPHTLASGERRISAEYIIVASGSQAIIPSFIQIEGQNNILTSTEALALDHVPSSMVIIGGGVIGIEFAYLLSRLGSQVTVLELMDHILPMVDEEVSGVAQRRMEKDGVTFRLGARVGRVENNTVYYEYNGQEESIAADGVLMAVGRAPYTEGLNAQAAGLLLERGAIPTDPTLCSNIPHIYAIGDVNGRSMLAHTASHEGLVALKNIYGERTEMDYHCIPSCIYLDPEIASIGLTEKQAREQYADVRVGKFPLAANGKSLVEGDSDGIFKVLIDGQYGEVLGAHLYGKHCTDMIAEIALAMTNELTAEEIIHTIHPHPTVSEAVAEVFMAAVDRAIHA